MKQRNERVHTSDQYYMPLLGGGGGGGISRKGKISNPVLDCRTSFYRWREARFPDSGGPRISRFVAYEGCASPVRIALGGAVAV